MKRCDCEIHTRDEDGHDAEEDARGCVDHEAGFGKFKTDYATTTIGRGSDEEVSEGLVQAMHEFLFRQFTGVVDVMGWLAPKATGDGPAAVVPSTEPSQEAIATAQGTLNAQLVSLHASLPACTTLVIFTGNSDPRQMASLNARKVEFQSAIKSGKKAKEMEKPQCCPASDGRALEEKVEKAKRGPLFLGIKSCP